MQLYANILRIAPFFGIDKIDILPILHEYGIDGGVASIWTSTFLL
jgi:hypothetical protein